MTRTHRGATARAIDAVALTKTYATKGSKSGVQALDGLTFAVDTGTVYGLLGPNGAGKSTTVKILTTLSKPDGGSAEVAGLDVVRNARDVRQAIGVVAQRSGLDVEATARENLVLQGEIHGLRAGQARSRAGELLDRFGLGDDGGRIVRTFSGGMQRKLDVALGLVHRPSVLFLDEPTTGLDPEARAGLWAEIETLARAEGLTILLTTHYLEEADNLADRVAIVDRGRIVVEGTPDELKGELHGDTISLELDPSTPPDQVAAARAALDLVGGVHHVVVDGRVLHARADAGARSVPGVLAALDAAAVTVASVTVARPSLDDVYLRYAGRSYGSAAADADGAPARILQGAS
jgi:ABC-2 type transport system ATP-binding protein